MKLHLPWWRHLRGCRPWQLASSCQSWACTRWGSSSPVVNFTNILQGALAPIFFFQKITKPNCKWWKAAQNTFVKKAARKMFVKLTPRLPWALRLRCRTAGKCCHHRWRQTPRWSHQPQLGAEKINLNQIRFWKL